MSSTSDSDSDIDYRYDAEEEDYGADGEVAEMRCTKIFACAAVLNGCPRSNVEGKRNARKSEMVWSCEGSSHHGGPSTAPEVIRHYHVVKKTIHNGWEARYPHRRWNTKGSPNCPFSDCSAKCPPENMNEHLMSFHKIPAFEGQEFNMKILWTTNTSRVQAALSYTGQRFYVVIDESDSRVTIWVAKLDDDQSLAATTTELPFSVRISLQPYSAVEIYPKPVKIRWRGVVVSSLHSGMDEGFQLNRDYLIRKLTRVDPESPGERASKLFVRLAENKLPVSFQSPSSRPSTANSGYSQSDGETHESSPGFPSYANATNVTRFVTKCPSSHFVPTPRTKCAKASESNSSDRFGSPIFSKPLVADGMEVSTRKKPVQSPQEANVEAVWSLDDLVDELESTGASSRRLPWSSEYEDCVAAELSLMRMTEDAQERSSDFFCHEENGFERHSQQVTGETEASQEASSFFIKQERKLPDSADSKLANECTSSNHKDDRKRAMPIENNELIRSKSVDSLPILKILNSADPFPALLGNDIHVQYGQGSAECVRRRSITCNKLQTPTQAKENVQGEKSSYRVVRYQSGLI